MTDRPLPAPARTFLLLVALASLTTGCFAATPDDEGAPAPRHLKVGLLQLTDALSSTETGFKEGLAERGWVEGEDLTFVYRHAKGNITNLGALAKEIAAEKPDIIFALTTPGVKAALAATEGTSIAVIGGPVLNPVPAIAESVARPGGRFTGVSPLVDASKQVDVLRQAIGPEPKRIGIITSGDHDEFLKQFGAAAGPAGFEITQLVVKSPEQVEEAFQTLLPTADALYIPPDNIVTNRASYLIEQAKANGIPLMMPTEDMVTAGALISYSADYKQLGRQAARMTLDVVNGADPAVVPLEYPERTRLAINLATAKALGIDVPESVLARASAVVR